MFIFFSVLKCIGMGGVGEGSGQLRPLKEGLKMETEMHRFPRVAYNGRYLGRVETLSTATALSTYRHLMRLE